MSPNPFDLSHKSSCHGWQLRLIILGHSSTAIVRHHCSTPLPSQSIARLHEWLSCDAKCSLLLCRPSENTAAEAELVAEDPHAAEDSLLLWPEDLAAVKVQTGLNNIATKLLFLLEPSSDGQKGAHTSVRSQFQQHVLQLARSYKKDLESEVWACLEPLDQLIRAHSTLLGFFQVLFYCTVASCNHCCLEIFCSVRPNLLYTHMKVQICRY